MAREERELTARWAVLEPLLPPQRPTTGRPNHRQVLEGSCGCCTPACRGGTCPIPSVPGGRSPAALTAGVARVCSTGYWAEITAGSAASWALRGRQRGPRPPARRRRTTPAERGGPQGDAHRRRMSPGAQPRRAEQQAAPARPGRWAAAGDRHRRAAARGPAAASVAGCRGSETVRLGRPSEPGSAA